MNDIIIINRDTATWNRMWELVTNKYTNLDGWQYMGTVIKETTVEHQFRNREYKGRRENFTVTEASQDAEGDYNVRT